MSTTPQKLMSDSREARIALAKAKALVIQTAEELQREDRDKSEDFTVLWSLGFKDLQNLEDFRCPGK